MSVDGDKGPSSAGALLITLYSSTALQFYRPTAAVVTVSQYKLELPAPALTVTAAAGEFVEDAPHYRAVNDPLGSFTSVPGELLTKLPNDLC